MKYVRPQIIGIEKAVDAVQSTSATKPGHFNDGMAATSPAYEADE
jgi:hypothetical protein